MAGELITLDQALLELENLIAVHEPSWTGHRKAELATDLAALLKPPDAPSDDGLPERYPPEVRTWQHEDSADVWHNYQKAALFLRLQMEEGRPPLYVKDPSEGQLLPRFRRIGCRGRRKICSLAIFSRPATTAYAGPTAPASTRK